MAGEVVDGELVYVIPLEDGTGSWVLMSSEYEGAQTCEVPAIEPEPASHAPTAVAASGFGLMLLAGLL